MKRFLTFVLIAVLGVLTIGCESKNGTTKNKTEKTTTHTTDGMTMDGMMNSTDTKTKGTTPAAGDMTTDKTTETTK